MKAIILAAGYATRLYPLTKNRPKALLPVKGRPIIEFIIDKLKKIKKIDEIIIVSNDKFNSLFVDWANQYEPGISLKVINDLTSSENTRLGSIGDLNFAIQKEKINTDILVLAGDNLFDFDLGNFIRFSQDKPHISVGIYDIKSPEATNKFGVVNMDRRQFLSKFVEKPTVPFSSLVAIGIYFIPRGTLKFIKEYLGLKNSRDALGHFIEWLLNKDKVLGYRFNGAWYDIGDIDVYEKANLNFK